MGNTSIYMLAIGAAVALGAIDDPTRITVGFFFSLFGLAGLGKSFGIMLEEFVDYFDVPVAVAALIAGVGGGVYTVAAPLAVLAGERFTHRKVVMLRGLIGGIALSLSSLLLNIEWVIFTYGALVGCSHGSVFGNGLVVVGQYFKEHRGRAMALAMAGSSIGLFAISGTLLIISGISFNQIACGMLYRPLTSYARNSRHRREQEDKFIDKTLEDVRETERVHNTDSVDSNKKLVKQENILHRDNDSSERIRDGENVSGRYGRQSYEHLELGDTHKQQAEVSETEIAIIHEKSKRGISYSKLKMFLRSTFECSILKDYVVVMFLIVNFLLFTGHIHFVIFMPATASRKGILRYNKAWLLSINAICDLAGRLAMGVVGDLKVIPRYKLLSITSALCGISILCFSFASRYWVMCIFVALFGFFSGGLVVNNTPTLIDLVGLRIMPKVVALVLFLHGVGLTIGQPVLGAVRDATGNYQIVNYINSASMVAGAALLSFYPAVKKKEEDKLNRQGKINVQL